MLEAGAWGLLAASSLVLGSLVVMLHRPGPRVLGLVMGFGAGVLLSAVSFELIEEAVDTAHGTGGTGLGFAIGALTFFTGDLLLARAGRSSGHDASRHATAGVPIVLGTILDGVPESAVLGLTLLETGKIGLSMLVAVFVSNVPEAVAASADLLDAGWSRGKVLALWTVVALASAGAAAAGYGLLDGASTDVIAFTFAFAAGAILTMLSTSMIPEGYELSGRPLGLVVTLGFGTAFAISYYGG